MNKCPHGYQLWRSASSCPTCARNDWSTPIRSYEELKEFMGEPADPQQEALERHGMIKSWLLRVGIRWEEIFPAPGLRPAQEIALHSLAGAYIIETLEDCFKL